MRAAPGAVASEHRGHLERLARRGAASVAGAGCSAVFGVLLVVIVTNGFPSTLAGTFFAATSAFLILESLALLGTDTGLVKWLPVHLVAGRTSDLRRTLVISALPVLGLSTVVAVASFAVAPSLAPRLVGSDGADEMTVLLRTLAVFIPVAALHDLAIAASRGLGSMRPTVLVENVGRLGLQALAVLVTYLLGGGAAALALAWGAPYVVGLAASASWLSLLLVRRGQSADEASPWGPLVQQFWSYTGPRAIARITQTALKRSDIILVAALASPADAALYTAATRFVVVGQLFVQAVQQALSPQIAALFARDDTRAATAVYQAATLWSMVFAWPFYLVLAGFAPALMSIFGNDYAVASDVAVILALTMLLATACGPVDAVLLMAGRSWLSLRNSVVALAVNIGLNLVLIPSWGIRGAAVSWAVAIVVRNLLPLLIVRRQLAMWPVTRSSVRVAIMTAGCFGGVAGFCAVSGAPTALAATLVAVSSVAYLGGIWLWRSALGLQVFGPVVRRRPLGV